MPGNTIGQALRLTSWGESHGPALGGVIDGVPPQICLDYQAIQHYLDRRRPGQDLTTPRKEQDQVEFLSGIFEEETLGTPIAFMVRNNDQRSKDYDNYKNVFRPGHGDYTYQKKYGIRDHRGGGRASGRTTLSLVVGGAIAFQVLRHLQINMTVRAGIVQLGPHTVDPENVQWSTIGSNPFHCPDPFAAAKWEQYLMELIAEGNSCGAIIEAHVNNVPAGLGEPLYDRLDADIAKILMGINAVKAVEIGDGLNAVDAKQGFDEMIPGLHEPHFTSNRSGGILAGISTGQPIVVRITFKATSSTRELRNSVDHDNQKVKLSVEGRHDPCIAMRAIPIVETALAFVLADHALRWQGQCGMQANL